MTPDRFSTYSLDQSPVGERVKRILASALQAVDPYQAVQKALELESGYLRVRDVTYPLDQVHRLIVIGAGKAGAPMARAVADLLGSKLEGGLVIVKDDHLDEAPSSGPFGMVEAGHPIPDERGEKATGKIVQQIKGLAEDDLIICLLSGGGSALLVSPVDRVSLDEIQELTARLLSSGASIQEINALRKHLDRVKGGQLARLASPARVVSLILSDVVGDPLDAIASSPTAPDPTTFQEAFSVLQRYALADSVSPAIREHLQRGLSGEIPETPKPGEVLFERVQNVIIASNLQAARAAAQQAQAGGFETLLLSCFIQGEARQAGRFFSAIARQIDHSGDPLPRPACLVAGGETTVTVRGDGLGGRNQELALSAAIEMEALPRTMLVTLATDGGDGPTDAAGAVVTGETVGRARAFGLDARWHLDRNDAYNFFDPLGDLIKCGPTRTNVNDLAFIFAY